MQAVNDLRTSVNKITAKYAELGKNEEVTKALKALSASARTKQRLGPSKECTAAIKWLGRFEGSVQSNTVELHREGGVDHVDVMLNGKGPVRMVFDTGAGPTTLSAELASRMNHNNQPLRGVNGGISRGSSTSSVQAVDRFFATAGFDFMLISVSHREDAKAAKGVRNE